MRRFVFTALLAALWSPALPAAPVASKTRPIRVLILDGQSAGPYHDWRLTTAVLKKELEDTGLFRVTVATSPRFGEDFSGFKPEFGSYQVIVSNIDAPDWPSDEKAQLEQFVESGGGLVVVHGADNSFPDWPAFNQMTGVGGWRDRSEKAGPIWYFKDGGLVPDDSAGPAGSHGLRLPFQVVTRSPEHPIMKGLPRVWMHAGVELCRIYDHIPARNGVGCYRQGDTEGPGRLSVRRDGQVSRRHCGDGSGFYEVAYDDEQLRWVGGCGAAGDATTCRRTED